jgi:hypothetical protein
MKAGMRKALVFGGLILALAASYRVSREDAEPAPETHKSPATHGRLSKGQTGAPTQPAQDGLGEAQRDAFVARDWTPPPPPAPKPLPLPPPPPTAPPLPYRYLGKWKEDGQLVVYLLIGNQAYLVKGGELLNGQWRVDEVNERSIRFTYVPLDQTASLNIGEPL